MVSFSRKVSKGIVDPIYIMGENKLYFEKMLNDLCDLTNRIIFVIIKPEFEFLEENSYE